MKVGNINSTYVQMHKKQANQGFKVSTGQDSFVNSQKSSQSQSFTGFFKRDKQTIIKKIDSTDPKKLTKHLKSTDIEIRNAALKRIATFYVANEIQENIVFSIAKDDKEDTSIRLTAINAMGTIENKKSMPVLQSIMNDKNRVVKVAANKAYFSKLFNESTTRFEQVLTAKFPLKKIQTPSKNQLEIMETYIDAIKGSSIQTLVSRKQIAAFAAINQDIPFEFRLKALKNAHEHDILSKNNWLFNIYKNEIIQKEEDPRILEFIIPRMASVMTNNDLSDFTHLLDNPSSQVQQATLRLYEKHGKREDIISIKNRLNKFDNKTKSVASYSINQIESRIPQDILDIERKIRNLPTGESMVLHFKEAPYKLEIKRLAEDEDEFKANDVVMRKNGMESPIIYSPNPVDKIRGFKSESEWIKLNTGDKVMIQGLETYIDVKTSPSLGSIRMNHSRSLREAGIEE